jgi:hypothetical protein
MLSEFSLRHNDRLAARTTDATAWTRDSVSRTFRQRAAYRDGGAFSASAQFIRRSRVEYRENRTRSADHLIDGRALYSSLSRFMTLDARYEVSSVRSAQTSRQYIRVERGRGDFRLDPAIGEFLPDPDGEYIERFDRAGDFVPVTRVYSSLRFELQPYRTLPASRNGFSGVIRHVSTDTYLSVDERSKTPDRRSLYLLRLSRFQRDSTTVSGNMTFRQDIVLFPQSRNFSLRLRYQRNSALNNQLITGSERRIHSEYGLRLRLPVSGSVAAEVELLRQIRQRRDFGRDRFRIHTTVGSVSLAHRPTPPLELLIRLQGGYDRDVMNGISTGQYGVVPGMSYAFRGRGRARFEFDWTHVRVAPSTAFPPFEMAGGRRPGNSARWLGNVDYRIGRNLSLLMHYDGRKDPRRPLIHTARMEMQAYF